MRNLAVAVSLLFFTLPSWGAAVYDGFNYPADPAPQYLGGRGNPLVWTKAGSGIDATIAAGNVAGAGLPNAIGNSVALSGLSTSNAVVDRIGLGGSGSFSSGALYYSLVLKVTDLTGLATSGGFFAGFNHLAPDSTSSVSRAVCRLQIRATDSTATRFNLGIRSDAWGGDSSTIVWDTTEFSAGSNIFVVAGYTFNSASSTDDVSKLWINPDPSTFGAASPPVTSLASSGCDLTPLQSFFLRQVDVAPNQTIVDEVRIGTSWADVTPRFIDDVVTINGQRLFPIVLSPGPPVNSLAPGGKNALQELRDAGVTVFRLPRTTDWNDQIIADEQAALDAAVAHGMYSWINLRELSNVASGDTAKEAALRQMVNRFKNHPGLGLWKNFDESAWAGVPAEDMIRGYQIIREEDPNHTVVQTHAPRLTVDQLRPYNGCADILALDIYPVGYPPGANSLEPNKEISMVGDWTKFLREVGEYGKPSMMILQITWSGVTKPGKTLRFPTLRQQRFMSYQAVINGARGLMYFGGNATAGMTPEDAQLGWNWRFWNRVLKRVVQELGTASPLAPALIAPESTLPVTVTGASDVEFCVREAGADLFILACKREGATVNVEFSGLPAWAGVGELLFEEPRKVTAANGKFTDWFGPFEVHAYRFHNGN